MKSLKSHKKINRLNVSLFILASIVTGLAPLNAMAEEKPMKMPMNMKMPMKMADNKTGSMASMKGDKMKMPAMRMQGGSAPKDARDPNANSGGFEYRGMGGWEETDEITVDKLIIDQLEYRGADGGDSVGWDVQGWRGTDYKKFWFKFEGANETASSAGDFELQGLYSKTIAPFWDFQVGLRYDREYDANDSSNRMFGVLGFQGLAPYWFEMEPSLYISEDGDVSARLVSSYDLLFTQKLILQPSMEVNLSANDVASVGIGKGINDLDFGLRLRYEISRKFAPYIGISWSKKYGDTADFSTAAGGDIEDTEILAGIRLWF